MTRPNEESRSSEGSGSRIGAPGEGIHDGRNGNTPPGQNERRRSALPGFRVFDELESAPYLPAEARDALERLAAEGRPLHGSEAFALLYLAAKVDRRHGQWFGALSKLAQTAGIDYGALRRSLAALEARGLVLKAGGGSGRLATYQILPDLYRSAHYARSGSDGTEDGARTMREQSAHNARSERALRADRARTMRDIRREEEGKEEGKEEGTPADQFQDLCREVAAEVMSERIADGYEVKYPRAFAAQLAASEEVRNEARRRMGPPEAFADLAAGIGHGMPEEAVR